MRYYIIILASLLFFACKRIEPLQGTIASFQKQSPQIQSKTIRIDFKVSYDSLFSLLGIQKGGTLYNSEKQPGLDFPLKLDLLNKPQIKIGKPDYLQLDLPVQVVAKPNIAGINTGLIQAKANLQLELKWLWKDINHHQVDDVRLRYSWLAKPEMRVLGFPIAVQGIVDPLIQKSLPDIQTKIGDQFSKFLQPANLNHVINRIPMNYPSDWGNVALESADIDMKDITFAANHLHGNLLVRTALTIGDKPENPSPNRWVELHSNGKQLPFRVDFSYQRLTKILASSLKIKEEQVIIVADSSTVHVKLLGLSGARSAVLIRLRPLLLKDGRLAASWSSMELEGMPFYLRGLSKRRIEKGMQSFVWSPESTVNLLNDHVSGLKLSDAKLLISSLYFTQGGIGLFGVIEGNWELKK